MRSLAGPPRLLRVLGNHVRFRVISTHSVLMTLDHGLIADVAVVFAMKAVLLMFEVRLIASVLRI